MLKSDFYNCASKYSKDSEPINQLWEEIEEAHSGTARYYHNLYHLQNLYNDLAEVKGIIDDWHSIIFAITYHDYVYDTSRTDNEELSAEIAVKRLLSINYPAGKISRCKAHILATKGHRQTEDNDTNLFTDADLSILGADWETYKQYAENIRKEYNNMAGFNMGRKNVLINFLKMPRLFKTDYFYSQYEAIARENIQREIVELL